MNIEALTKFIRESNKIERIFREPSPAETGAYIDFLEAPDVTVVSLERFQGIIAPGKPTRRQPGMDVQVGRHIAPAGGAMIEPQLAAILRGIEAGVSPWETHCRFEDLHPFMDGNGRTGRVLWLRQMGGPEWIPLGFLHTFYYQTLDRVSR